MADYYHAKAEIFESQKNFAQIQLDYAFSNRNVGEMVTHQVVKAGETFKELIHENRCHLSLMSRQLRESDEESRIMMETVAQLMKKVEQNEIKIGLVE